MVVFSACYCTFLHALLYITCVYTYISLIKFILMACYGTQIYVRWLRNLKTFDGAREVTDKLRKMYANYWPKSPKFHGKLQNFAPTLSRGLSKIRWVIHKICDVQVPQCYVHNVRLLFAWADLCLFNPQIVIPWNHQRTKDGYWK